MSEIDAIFASKGKAKATDPEAPAPKSSKKKKKQKKNTSDPQQAPTASKKRPAPETIVDTSVQIPQKRQKTDRPSEQQKSKPKKSKEEEDSFKDSRGTGPRRKTEEGWSIYKEDELGISNGGGDTPLCPFDCDCCF
ncbi:hypothetical protein MD484_g1400, partial [Candolleomyces efflorescens]